ncbi:MAG: acetamidase [Gemmatimonadetes bacterium]|jgi:amidase|nr:acetamidase [Gemmatimonadota bacterium]
MVNIDSSRFLCELAADSPIAAEVTPGSTLSIHCRHALDMKVGPGPVRAEDANPGTGPIGVEGAFPGQALKVEILDIEPESPGHVAGGWEGEIQATEIIAGKVHFHGAEIPLAPMIGTFGVAPAGGSWSTKDAGPFGGNMDVNDLAPGATLYLPVFQPGGRFVLGDVHAVMGDGEIGGQGLEVAATVCLRVEIEPEPLTDRVYLMRDDRLVVVGSAETVEEATDDAVAAMIDIIASAGAMSAFHARKFLGLAADTFFGQHCCPIKTVRVALPLNYLPELRAAIHGE